MPGQEAYVSLVTNDNYALGALALGRSLRDTLTTRKLSLLATNEVSDTMRERLSSIWDELTVVALLDSEDEERLALLTRPELGVTFSKLHAWRLTQYSKCVFLDADTLVLENVDELFEREELSAAPDIGWPDCFNSGVFVFEPSMETHGNLLEMARQTGSFDGGDQGLLNLYWADWATKDIKYHLPFIYNMVPNAAYGYAPAFLRFGRNAKIIHFIGSVKPWHHQYVPGVDSVVLAPGSYSSTNVVYDFIKLWWQTYNTTGQPSTPGSTGPPPHHSLPPSSSSLPSLYYHSCPPHHHLVTSFIKSGFVRPSFPRSSPPPLSHYSVHAPPSSPVMFRSPSPAPPGCAEGSTEDDVTDIPMHTDSVHLTHPPSPSSLPLPPSSPTNSQGGAEYATHGAPVVAGELYYPSDKSREQHDIEQGKIDYTGRHTFEQLVQGALDQHLAEDSELGD